MYCHLCNKKTEYFYDKKKKILYYHCMPCEYIYKSSEYYQDLQKQKERYDLHQNNEEDRGYRAYFQRFLDYIFTKIPPVNNALDFGCGKTSLLARMFNENNISCDYYDPIYHPQREYKDKYYDLIVSVEVFEHLHRPRKIFASLIEKLKIGGYLAIQTEFHPNNKEKFKSWYYHQDPTHIVFYRKKSFEVLAEMYHSKFVASNEKNIVILKKEY